MAIVWSPRRQTGRSARYVHIRTYGCQMNEHDSERIAGVLEADGYVRAEDLTAPTSWC